MDRRSYLAAAGTAALVGLGGCLGLTGGGGNYDVGMSPTAFTPSTVTVARGEEVVWSNGTAKSHTVTAYEESLPEGAAFFASGDYDDEATARRAWRNDSGGAIRSGETFSYTFEMPGRYEYFCVPHEESGMKGAVVVEDRTLSPTPTATETE